MPIRLTAFLSDGPALRRVFPAGGSYVLGRGDDADMRFPDDRVSRAHARLTSRPDGGWVLEDLASKNGTQLDGRLIDEVLITKNAWASLGGALMLLEHVDEEETRASASSETKRATSAKQFHKIIDAGRTASGVFEHLADSVIDLSGCDRCSVWFAGVENEPALAYRRGKAQPPESLSTVREALERSVEVISNDVDGVAALARRESIMFGGVRALVCMPLDISGAPRGAVYADSRKPGKYFSELDIDLLRSLAGHAALTLASLRLRDQIADLAAQR